ncbi:MAG: adenylate/guanylate cyclase domain-containing protein [Acidimicrobiia bacterium]|nr:MAG: adenylate/guanylate cyclase domain-containing protein [Acidimicrobiia bacterium]
MICGNCGAANDGTHKFCFECGTALNAVCPSCGHANGPGHKFCSECGHDLTAIAAATPTATPAAETPASEPGERRFVSVLFADLVGFTTFSESRDPEEVRAMLTRYFDRAREVIERFGGEVDKFIGDAVTAFWGAKQTQEDDAERAVRAALELIDAVAALGGELDIPELAVRAGVLSGETSVGSGGNEKGLVVGDIVNTASRLQSAADPGTVFVGDSTKQLSEAAIQYESVGEQDMKGKSVPVAAWRALSVVGQRGGRGRWETLEPPFVGRDDELRLLKDQLHATTRDRTSRLVSIVGEAGIGKSRLAWELQKYMDGLTEVFRWHQGRSPAYGEGVTFWALTEMVRSRAGIAETDEPLKARTKLRTVVAEFVPDSEERQWIEPRLAGLLGLDEMPSGDRNELFAALRTFFQRVAANETAVLLFEDIHWADDGQLEFIEELVEMSKDHPILVITVARPQLLDRHPSWGSARHHFLSTHLGPLSDNEMGELLTGMAPGISEQVVDLIVERAGGVPLYAVEYVRMLINSGDIVLEGSRYRHVGELEGVALPDSLHAMVGARLDRLDEEQRALIQDAAVLGQSFTLEGMTVLRDTPADELEPRLRELARQELLRYDTDPRSPERGQFQFVQSVIREVAYGRIAKTERKDRHLKVAEYYEKEAPIEGAAVIASHYMDAYEAGPDEALADKARAALMNAAERAIELRSYAQTLTLVEQAIEVPGNEAQQAPLWELAARAAGAVFRHEDSVSYARRALDWYLERGSPTDIVRGATVLGRAYVDSDEPVDAVAAMALYFDAERVGEPEMMALGAELSLAQMRSFRNQESADVALAVLMAAEASGNTEVAIDAMNTRGTVLGSLGRVFESVALLREALRLAEQHTLPYPTLRAINNLEVIESANGIAGQRAGWARGYELAQRVRDGGLVVRMAFNYSAGLVEDGAFEKAIAVLTELDLGESVWADFFAVLIEQIRWVQTGDPVHIERARQANDPLLKHPEPQYRSGAVDSEVDLSWLESDFEKVLELAQQVDPALGYHTFRHRAIGAAIRLGNADALRAAIDLIEPNGRRFDVLRFAGDTGLELLEGDADRAAVMFGQLIDQLAEVESPRFAAEWKAIFAEVMPDRQEATAAAQEAYDWFSAVGAHGYLDYFSHVWQQQLGEEAAAG